MIVKHASSAADAKHYATERLREEFLIEQLFHPERIQVVYSHIDRVVALGAQPLHGALALSEFIESSAFGTDFLLQRREMGIVNLGGDGVVVCDEQEYTLERLDALYIGQGGREISFRSLDAATPACFYCLSTPAHCHYPTRVIKKAQANHLELGSQETANARTLTQYIHPDILPSCQLSMGITHLHPGSVWNTMPAHTHERRMEVYLYFNVDADQTVFHFMGEPQQTRHLVVKNHQLVISPSWSIHSGCGTRHYSFVWGMAGENQTFDDMDFIATNQLK